MKIAKADALATALTALTEREARILALRFGLGGGKEHTLEEVGTLCGITRERVRQIESRSWVSICRAARVILLSMPRPMTDRQAWEHELREELPAQLAAYRKEVDATPTTFKERRERLEWQIRRAEKRMADLRARLQGVENG
jgi:hypothetical protein